MRRLFDPRFWLRSLFLPQECVLCGASVCHPDWRPLCEDCLRDVPRMPGLCCRCCGAPLNLVEQGWTSCAGCRLGDPGFDRACSAGPFRGTLRRLLHEYKFRGHHRLAAPLAGLAAAAFRETLAAEGWDCLVPVPGQRRRGRDRSLDHVAMLAAQVSAHLGLPVQRLARRTRAIPPQVGLSAARRELNVAGAFRAERAGRRHRVVVFDDILTSGATARAMAKCLRRAGVRRVAVLTVARTDLGSETPHGQARTSAE